MFVIPANTVIVSSALPLRLVKNFGTILLFARKE